MNESWEDDGDKHRIRAILTVVANSKIYVVPNKERTLPK